MLKNYWYVIEKYFSPNRKNNFGTELKALCDIYNGKGFKPNIKSWEKTIREVNVNTFEEIGSVIRTLASEKRKSIKVLVVILLTEKKNEQFQAKKFPTLE